MDKTEFIITILTRLDVENKNVNAIIRSLYYSTLEKHHYGSTPSWLVAHQILYLLKPESRWRISS